MKEEEEGTTDNGRPADGCRREHPASLPSILISVPGEVDDDAVKDPPERAFDGMRRRVSRAARG